MSHALSKQELAARFEEAGYQPVSTSDLPDGIVVFRTGRTYRFQHATFERTYAIDELGMVGWPVYSDRNSEPDPLQRSVTNLIGREKFLEGLREHEHRIVYILAKQRRALESLRDQQRPNAQPGQTSQVSAID